MKLHAKITNNGSLTKQETRVLQLLCTGLLRKQIAQQLHRSYGSVSKQIESIALKLDAHSAAEIVAKAVASDLVQISYKALVMILICNSCFLGIDDTARRPPKPPRSISHYQAKTKREI